VWRGPAKLITQPSEFSFWLQAECSVQPWQCPRPSQSPVGMRTVSRAPAASLAVAMIVPALKALRRAPAASRAVAMMPPVAMLPPAEALPFVIFAGKQFQLLAAITVNRCSCATRTDPRCISFTRIARPIISASIAPWISYDSGVAAFPGTGEIGEASCATGGCIILRSDMCG
jgi:hypothetical protein